MGQRNRVRGLRGAAVLAVGLLALSACGGGSDDDKASGAKELRLWHYESADGAMGQAWTAAIKKFEETHPGVKVKFEEKSFEQINTRAARWR